MVPKRTKTFVIALGGNSILRAKQKGTAEEQYASLDRTAEQLLDLLSSGNRIVITHANGPQVGNLLLADETAKNVVPPMPLDVLGAQTEGYMGYMIQNTLANHLRRAGAPHRRHSRLGYMSGEVLWANSRSNHLGILLIATPSEKNEPGPSEPVGC